MTIQIQI